MKLSKSSKDKARKIFDVFSTSLNLAALLTDSKKLKTVLFTSQTFRNLIDYIPAKKEQKVWEQKGYLELFDLKTIIKNTRLYDIIIPSLLTRDLEIEKCENDESVTYIYDTKKEIFLYLDSDSWYIRLYAATKKENPEEAKEHIKSYIKSLINDVYPNSIYHFDYDYIEQKFVLSDYDFNLPNLDYSNADITYNEIKSAIDKGYKRSYMLYGEPGCGKSLAIRYITTKLQNHFSNKKTLVIAGRTLDFASKSLLDLIRILQINYVIIDDLDRSTNLVNLLSELEEINNLVDLFIVSVNHITKIDPAVKRAGRIDRVIDFSNIVDKKSLILKTGILENSDIYNDLFKLTVSGISEFSKRVEIFGLEQAKLSISDLQNR